MAGEHHFWSHNGRDMAEKLEMTCDIYRGSALMYTDHEDIVAIKEKFKGLYVNAQVSNSYV